MEKDEARRIIKGLQSLVFNRGDGAIERGDVETVLSDVAAYVEENKPKRREKKSRDRMESSGRDRGDE
jgi:hypothetical protein